MPRKKAAKSILALYLVVSFALGAAAGYFLFSVPPEKIFDVAVVGNTSYNTEVVRTESNILAVSSEGEGMIGRALIEMRPGSGRVLMNTNPFVEPDTQYSVETAKRVAESYTKKSFAKSDIIVSFDIGVYGNDSGQVVGGPSAGASIALAIISAAGKEEVRPDVAITGTIEPDGSIGAVGAVLEKGEAAAKNGTKLFLVPDGQEKIIYYEKKVENQRVGSTAIQRVAYVPKVLSLNEYMREQWNMSVIEVSDIHEAARYAITGAGPLPPA